VSVRGVSRFVADLLRHRRPKPFAVSEDEAGALRAAVELSAARAGADLPTEEFVTALHAKLRADLADGPPARRDRAGVQNGSRRRFLYGASVVAASAASAAVAIEVTHEPATTGEGAAPAQEPAQEVLEPSNGSWHTVAASADLPADGVHAFDTGTVRGFVRRTGGRLVSVSGICTHQGCRLTLDTAGQRLDCPCHRTAFTLDGQVIAYQLRVRPRPLPLLPVREQDGHIQVLVP
jgi:cytochrome b6-f complex iron-sulfur subunit